ncbi:hypothetical protein HDU96_004734 [Phlyctochytrium bullatum]|nr:hypothetical protein HDU96_004734 [Phlyctochytrium bullatum]
MTQTTLDVRWRQGVSPVKAKAAMLLALVALSGIPSAVDANPFFNTPNSNYLNGTQCPVPIRRNVACPIICTSEDPMRVCPVEVRPSCPQGLNYCADGNCRNSCEGVKPVCECAQGYSPGGQSDKPGAPYMPCNITAFKVDVPQYLQQKNKTGSNGNDDDPLRVTCKTKFRIEPGLSATETLYFFNICQQPPAWRNVSSLIAPEFIFFYGVLGVELFILLLHYLYKRVRESPFRGSHDGSAILRGSGGKAALPLPPSADGEKGEYTPGAPFLGASATAVELSDLRSEEFVAEEGTGGGAGGSGKVPSDLHFLGYRPDPVGAFTSVTVAVVSFFWVVLLAVLILDYYAVFGGMNFRTNSDMIFYDHDLLSTVFIVVWHIAALWFVFLKYRQSRSRAYFGRRVSLQAATFVVVEKKERPAVHMANMGALVEWIWKVEAKLQKIFGSGTNRTVFVNSFEVSVSIVPVQRTSGGRRFIEFECVRYVFNETLCTFEPYTFTVGPTYGDLHRQVEGLHSTDAADRIELVGPNAIAFQGDTFGSAMKKEFSGIFYIYQLMFLAICYYAYYYMGIVLTLVIVVSGIVKVLVYLHAQKRVLSMANFKGTVKLLRNGLWVTVSTTEVVPGDVMEVVPSDHVLPVDAVLVDGGAVCDESSLTGEALPVVKVAVRKDDGVRFRRGDDSSKNHCLYAGCHVLETQPSKPSAPVIAIVFATGATTSKGRLVRDILYPSSVSFVFQEHLKIVFPMLIVWGIVMLGASIGMIGNQGVDSWFYGMFTISQVLSPLLPAVLVIGQSVASERLAKRGILCVDLDRITLSGKVKVFCFDKTGTLTKEGLNFLGIQAVHQTSSAQPTFGAVLQDFTLFPEVIRHAMLTCHSVSTVGKQLVGNFVDVEMFRATGGALAPGASVSSGAGASAAEGFTVVYPVTNGDPNLEIIKRFEFVHSHAYMSAVMRDPITGKLRVYLKGSYEKIRDLSDPASVPRNFQETATRHASQGCYVLAFARRDLPESVTVEKVMSGQLSREELEKGAQLVGLVLFRNELKHDTPDALDELRDGGCRLVMITGDNANTAVFIGKASGMIRHQVTGEPEVVLGDWDKEKRAVVWKNLDENKDVSWQDLEAMLVRSKSGGRPVELAVTGKAFNSLKADNRLRGMLFDIRIFARMTPEDKVNCVRLHMERAVTAMCGDGGNDAGALKAAHAGIALSEAESSVVSHFSSRQRSIFSCVELLKEARCSLDVSFASYKYLIMYGEVLAFLGLIQYYFVVNMSQAVWVLIDGSTVPLSWALTMARPAVRLAVTRPTARLLGPETLTSVVGQIVINVVFQVASVVLLFNQPWFRCNEFDGRQVDVRRWWELGDNYEGEVTGLLGTLQIVFAAAVFNIGSTYRRGFFRNWIFVLVWTAIVTLLSFVILADPNSLGCLFHVNCGTPEALASLNRDQGTNYRTDFLGIPSIYHAFSGHNVMPWSFRWAFWGLAAGNFTALVLFEWVVVLGPGRVLARKLWPLKRLNFRE